MDIRPHERIVFQLRSLWLKMNEQPLTIEAPGKPFEHERLFQSKLQLFYDSGVENPSAVYRVPE